ncbi:MAG TPA: cysteine desulfurase CsdA [Bacteroidetes bacterium]|nr:cysteine desulfurase CsdA [Bacteroidota bacterium]
MNEVLQEKKIIDVEQIRSQFPILNRKVNGQPLVYLDNAATTQKPQAVLDAIQKYYSEINANIHRGVHTLSQEATDAYEYSRKTIADFINAKSSEIIFTRGTTESINLVASCFGKKFVNAGDEILVTEMEHHSNIVPWQLMCEERKAVLKVIPVTDSGELMLDELTKLLSSKTKLLALTHVSNTLGTVNDVKEIISLAHKNGTAILIDGAQAIAHTQVDVQELDCDFYCFSGHKMYGPTGIGILFGKEKFLNEFPPYQGGGGMIKEVSFAKTTYADSPMKFEAGTPNIEGGIVLGEAVKWMKNVGVKNIAEHEHELLHYAIAQLKTIDGVRIIGEAKNHASAVSFLVGTNHPYDTGVILDKLGIAVRTGHHCNQPLMKRFNIPGTVRASFAVYNANEEVDKLIEGVKRAKKMLS